MIVELARDEAIALEAEAKITIEGIDQLPQPTDISLRCRDRLERAYLKLKAAIDETVEAA